MRLRLLFFTAVTLACGFAGGWFGAIAYHGPRFEHSGWFISQFHGSYSTFAFGATNADLESKIKELTGDDRARAFAVPSIGSYVIYYYAPQRLGGKQDEELRSYVEDRLGKHEADWGKANEKKA